MAKPKRPGSGTPPSAGGTRITFYGFGAYVGAVRGPTHCDWWPDDPVNLNWAPGALISTDLSKNPTAARNGVIGIADIQVDDHRVDGGLTGVGPRFPQGSMVGAIWLRDTYWQGLTNPPRHPTTSDGQPHELTCHLYLDGPLQGRRFFGFHAKVVGKNGPLTRLLIFHGARSRVPGERPAGPFWIDLAQDAHPVEPGGTEIGSKTEGALYLDETTARQLTLRYPKLPPAAGSDFI